MRGRGQGLGLLLGQAGEAGCSPTGFLLHGALVCPAQLGLGVRQGFLRLSAPVFGLFLLGRWRTAWVSTACFPREKDNLGMEDGEPCVARAQVSPAVCVGTVALPPAQSAGWDVGTKQAVRCHPEASRAGGGQGTGGPVGSRSRGDPSCFAAPGCVELPPSQTWSFPWAVSHPRCRGLLPTQAPASSRSCRVSGRAHGVVRALCPGPHCPHSSSSPWATCPFKPALWGISFTKLLGIFPKV